jgi:GTP cyclohydrolase I
MQRWLVRVGFIEGRTGGAIAARVLGRTARVNRRLISAWFLCDRVPAYDIPEARKGPEGRWHRRRPVIRPCGSGVGVSTAEALILSPGVDLHRAEAAVRELLLAVGEDPDREGLRDTPARVARAFQEIFSGLFAEPADVLEKVFEENHHELVLVTDIPLFSVCEHHLLPWHGTAAIGYIPGPRGRVTGLSKLARLADLYAKRPQLQERLTSQVADAVEQRLKPAGVIAVVRAENLCMGMRGIQKPGAVTLTSAVEGSFRPTAALEGKR